MGKTDRPTIRALMLGSGPSQDSATVIDRLLGASGDVAFHWDMRSDQMEWYGPALAFFEIHNLDAVNSGERFSLRINDEDQALRLQALSDNMEQGKIIDCAYRFRCQDGSFIWLHEKGSLTCDEQGTPVAMQAVLRNISERKQQESLLEHRANYDDLTGHLNRSRLREAIQNAIAYNSRYGEEAGYLAIGIDKLAAINDAYGHQIGDEMIVAIAQRIERCLRITDFIGRIAGDRFGVVLPHTGGTAIEVTAQRILSAVHNSPIDTSEASIPMTVSIGGIGFPSDAQTAHDVMVAAESALQQAKDIGRNCYQSYQMSEEQRGRQRQHLMVGETVMKALDEQRIMLAYQPVICAVDGHVSYYETLLRMRSPEGEVITAGSFVPIIEKMGMIRALDRRALELAVDDLRRFPDVVLAVNVSSLTITDPYWLRALMSLVRGRPAIAQRLIVEITETAALEDFALTARFVGAVRDLGCKVALDDFGSGYTSFRHMKSLTVDVVKIDGSFISGVDRNPENQLFVKTLLGLAAGFGLATVAECVETEAEADILTSQGVDYLQGYYFGKPTLTPDWREGLGEAIAQYPNSCFIAGPAQVIKPD